MERLVYNLVKDRPWLKDGLKLAYQGAFSIFGRRRERLPKAWIVRDHCFFGFHDKSPWSHDGRWLLGHRYQGLGNEPDGNQNPVEIVAFGGENWTEACVVGASRAWNWQQGSQLQWVGRSEYLICNDFVDGICTSVELDLHGHQRRIHPHPVAAVAPNGKLFAAICFQAFGAGMPAYGYAFAAHRAKSNVDPDTLVLFADSGREVVKVRGRDLPVSEKEKGAGESFVSHVIFSSNSERVAFMRRTAIPGRRVRSALFVYDTVTGEIERAPFDNMVSHYCWLGSEKIFAFANSDSAADGFFVWNLGSRQLKPWSRVLGNKDGHPHPSGDGKWVVIDTYPDRQRLQTLRLWETETENSLDLARLFSPITFWGDQRVDLHPRIRNDGKYVCVDCSTTGLRGLATLVLQI